MARGCCSDPTHIGTTAASKTTSSTALGGKNKLVVLYCGPTAACGDALSRCLRVACPGAVYEGDWVDGKRHGRGVLTLPCGGGRYEGEFRDGRRHGQGTMVSDGSISYTGRWEDDQVCGMGRLTLGWGTCMGESDRRVMYTHTHSLATSCADNGRSIQKIWKKHPYAGIVRRLRREEEAQRVAAQRRYDEITQLGRMLALDDMVSGRLLAYAVAVADLCCMWWWRVTGVGGSRGKRGA